MSIEVILKAAEYIERREREAEHGYAMVRPYVSEGISSRRRTVSMSSAKRSPSTSVGVRSLHNELEKTRRAQLRFCLERLKSIVPLGRNASRHTTLGLLKDAKLLIQRLERTQLDQREVMQQLRSEQHRLQQHLDELTMAGRGQFVSTGSHYDDLSCQYRIHSSLSESSNGSLSSLTGYSSSEHEEIDVIGSSSQDASIDSDADEADDPMSSANEAFTLSLHLSRPL